MCAKISNAFELIQDEIAHKRPTLQNLDERLFPTNVECHPRQSTLIEISGTNGSGKTQLLQYIMALCVIPADFGGKQSRVIFIDSKSKFDPLVFHSQVENIIKQRAKPGNIFTESELNAEDNITQIALNCLRSVTILYSFSPDDLALALDDVENMLMEDENGDIVLLAFDGLDAFYWIENQERKRRMLTHYAQMTERLHSICVSNCITSAYTVDSNYVQAKTAGTSTGRLTKSPDYKLVLEWNQAGQTRTLNGLNIDINKNGFTFL